MHTHYLSARHTADAAYIQGVSKQIVDWLIQLFKLSKMCLRKLHVAVQLSAKIEFGDTGMILMDV